VGFEPIIPATERAKTVLALDRSATVTGKVEVTVDKNETKLNSNRKFECRCAIFNFKQIYYLVVDTLTDGQMNRHVDIHLTYFIRMKTNYKLANTVLFTANNNTPIEV
jgi:hypothetical protein